MAFQISKGDRAKDEVRGEPEGLGERIEKDGSQDHEYHQAPGDEAPGNVGPGQEDSCPRPGHDEELGHDEVHRVTAQEIIRFAPIQKEVTGRADPSHVHPALEEAG